MCTQVSKSNDVYELVMDYFNGSNGQPGFRQMERERLLAGQRARVGSSKPDVSKMKVIYWFIEKLVQDDGKRSL